MARKLMMDQPSVSRDLLNRGFIFNSYTELCKQLGLKSKGEGNELAWRLEELLKKEVLDIELEDKFDF